MSRLLRLSIIQISRTAILAVAFVLLILIGVDYLLQIDPVRTEVDRYYRWVPLAKLEFWPMLVLSVLCIAVPVFYMLTAIVDDRLSRGIVGRGKSGEDICLSPEAIERAVTREVKSQVPEVVKVRDCIAIQGRRAARVTLSLAVNDKTPVPSVQSQARHVVQDTLTRLIGYSDGAQVRIKVTRIVGPRSAGKKPVRRGKNGKPAKAKT